VTRRGRASAAVAALALALAGAAAPGSVGIPERPVYLAMGDSVAAGVGSSADPAEWSARGYVGRLAAQLVVALDCAPLRWYRPREGCPDLQTRNVARPGATSASLREEQLPAAAALLRARNADGDPRGDVELVTVTIGGNDVFGPVVAACLTPPSPGSPGAPDCAATVAAALESFAANYARILATLRRAGGADVRLLTMTYDNPLATCVLGRDPGAVALADVVLEGGSLPDGATVPEGLNDVVRASSARVGAEVAETYGLLRDEDFVGGADCLHPDASGHARIAAAFLAALGD
jgi:lysophospholipase L1-like esterase